MTQSRDRRERKCEEKKVRLGHREEIHLQEVCSGTSNSVVDGEGKKMINETKESDPWK